MGLLLQKRIREPVMLYEFHYFKVNPILKKK